MAAELSILVGGEAGQGVQTVGFIVSKAMSRGGLSVFADQDYESRIRGGHNFFRIRVSDTEVRSVAEQVDILVALNKDTIDLHRAEVKAGGVLIYDRETVKADVQGDSLLDVPFERLAVEVGGNKLMTNTAAVGAAMGVCGYDFDTVARVLRDHFGGAGKEQLAEGNIKVARAGYDHASRSESRKLAQCIRPVGTGNRMLITGNEATAIGAMAAGCKFVAAYPMTPASPIMEYIANKGRKYQTVVLQPEDEISAINMAVGASYAGVRAMTATSGGGFCLMVEGLSLAGMTETPVVVILGQRPGPAIGLPTRTEQAELLFAIHAGHGEFPRAVLAPATIEECFYATVKAFNLAERYQTPVIVINDHHLATSYTTIPRIDLKQVKIDRGDILSEEQSNKAADYKRYRISESGVSPRALPGLGKALVVADSDEHNEEGHIIEDAETRTRMDSKRMRKLEGLRREISRPRFHEKPGARMTLVGWGSTYGAVAEAQDRLDKDKVPVNVLHVSEVWPFPSETVTAALRKTAKNIVVESNATSQLGQLVRSETGIQMTDSILRFDGRPITSNYIIDHLKREV